jgi:glycosyltransferase involved in cell wall biosynthesis
VISSLATRLARRRAWEDRVKPRGVVMLLANNPYPEDERVRREALTLVEHGYTVSVICPRAHGQPEAETVRGVHVYRYEQRIRPRGTVGYVLEYIHAPLVALRVSVRVLRRHGFDVVHAHNPPDTLVLVGAIYKFLLGKRFVFDHHDIAPEMYAARFGPRARRIVFESLVLMERISCRLADRVITTNESYREIESQRGGVPIEKIAVVRNGPDLADLEPVTPDASLRAKAETILGYLGVMGFQDGVKNLLDALHVLVFDLGRVDTLAVLVGDGDARPDLERLATERGLEEHVCFTGFLDYDEWRRVLSTADVCVVPDPSNPYNDRSTIVKIMDYMALGKPIVAFDLPEHRVTADGAVSFVPANDVRALAVRIAELMDDPARRSAMGAQARRRARGALCWPSSGDVLVESYGALFSTSARSREAGRTSEPPDPGKRRDEDDARLRPRGGEGRATIA